MRPAACWRPSPNSGTCGDSRWTTGNQSAYSRCIFSVDVKRPGWGRFFKVFFGLFIATLISWCAFHVRPKESSPRVSLAVGATFAAAAVTVAINSMLSRHERRDLGGQAHLAHALCHYSVSRETIAALTLFAHGKEAIQRQLDRWCAVVFPLSYFVVLVAIVI